MQEFLQDSRKLFGIIASVASVRDAFGPEDVIHLRARMIHHNLDSLAKRIPHRQIIREALSEDLETVSAMYAAFQQASSTDKLAAARTCLHAVETAFRPQILAFRLDTKPLFHCTV